MQEDRVKLIVIVVLALLAALVVAPMKDKGLEFLNKARIVPGIDLAGGSEINYRLLVPEGERKDMDRHIQDAITVLDLRINSRGLKEPKISPAGDDMISIQIPGVDQDELANFKALLETVGKLELKVVAHWDKQQEFISTKKVPAGYEAYQKPADTRNARFGDKMLVRKDVVINGQQIKNAQIALDARGGGAGDGPAFMVLFELTSDGSAEFDAAAAELFSWGGEPDHKDNGLIAIILDGKIISAPAIQTSSFGGSGQITGNFSQKEAKDLSIILKSGSLPFPIGSRVTEEIDNQTVVKDIRGVPESENTVGPSLGQDSIRRGILSIAVAGALIMVFLILYYRGPGVIAVITLILSMLFLMAILAFFKATLTLPGIAGIILTVGMAVDANILILERIREEMGKGKSAMQAFESGHEQAFSAILDANVTTLIAAGVLYYLGTGAVKGFAVTLSIGVVTTLFSVLYCGRTFLRMLVAGGSIREFKMMSVVKNTKVRFTSAMRLCLVISGVLIVGSVLLFQQSGDQKWGIDFMGGTRHIFTFDDKQSIEEVRSRVASIENEEGLPKYPQAQVQTIAETDEKGGSGSGWRSFQLRTSHRNKDEVKADLEKVFAGKLSHSPFDEVPKEELPANPRYFSSGPAGAAAYLFFDQEIADLSEIRKKIIDKRPRGISESLGEPHLKLEPAPETPPTPGRTRAMLVLYEGDVKGNDQLLEKVKTEVKALGKAGEIPLSVAPFTLEQKIGASVAEELKNSTILALIVSWILIIAYIAIRFTSWKYGMAAVIALIHDAIITVGFICLCVVVIPESLGIGFEMNVTTVAALLTIIGYSVNDTIITFDRIRENSLLMKKETFREIIDRSINQTLPRTILTSATTWITVVTLYLVTMKSGGGIATFAFPLIVGLIVGTYSSIFIAAPIVVAWFADKNAPKPAKS